MSKIIIKESDLINIINSSLINEGFMQRVGQTLGGLGYTAKAGVRNFSQGFNAGQEFAKHPFDYLGRKFKEKVNKVAYSGDISSYELKKSISDFIKVGGKYAKNDIAAYACQVIANYAISRQFANSMNMQSNATYQYRAKYSAYKNRFEEFSSRYLHPSTQYDNTRDKNYDFKKQLKLKQNYAKIIESFGIDINSIMQQDMQYYRTRYQNSRQ